jgi:hypothetical protein
MEVELLSPGMQHSGDSEIAPEPVAPKLQQTLCGAVEEQRVKSVRVGEHQGIEFLGQSEDAVVVRDRQKTLGLLVEPLTAFDGLAARTMPVAAGAWRPVPMLTMRTLEKIGSQCRGTTGGKVPEHPKLVLAQFEQRQHSGEKSTQDSAQR